MTVFKPRCSAWHPDRESRCGREEGHGGAHRNFTEKEWSDAPDDMDGGVTAAQIEKEAEGLSYWRECAEGLHATVVELQDATEVLRARATKAERERDDALAMARLWKEATRRAVRMRQSLTDMYAGAFDQMEARAEKAEAERDDLRQTRRRLLGKIDALTSELRDTYHPPRAELIARTRQAEKELGEARRLLGEALDSHDETLRDIASGKYAAEPRPLTPRQNLAALWESAHRPVGGRIPAGTAIITRSDYGSGDVRYQTLEATGRDLPDPGRTLERNYPYGPENGEEYRLLDPPARPEGAEELARLIADADVGEWDCGDLADALLAAGRVRVITKEDPR